MVNWNSCEAEYVDVSRIEDGHVTFRLIKPLHERALVKGSKEFSYCKDCLEILSVDME